jgi:hypothetical protein
VVSILACLLDDIEQHLKTFVDQSPNAWVFRGEKDRAAQVNLECALASNDRVAEVGFEGLRFHDLRHIGKTLAASAGWEH